MAWISNCLDVLVYSRFCSAEGPVAEMFPLPPSSGPEQELSIYMTTPPGDNEMVPSLHFLSSKTDSR
ncbi:hypothetical protein CapIbe_009006 [Capra ibex]